MNKTLTAGIKVEIAGMQTCELPSGHIVTCPCGRSLRSGQLRNGFYAEQANRAWESAGRTLRKDAFEDIDLREFANVDMGRGLGRDAIGEPIKLDEVVLLWIAHAGGDGSLVVMPSSPECPVRWVTAGGHIGTNGAMLWYNPAEDAYDVFDDERNLRLGAENGDVQYDILVIGRMIDRTLPSEQ